MTWLRISSCADAPLAVEHTVMSAGMIAMSRVIRRRSHGPQPDVQEAFHHDLAGQRAGQRRVLTGEQQRDGEKRAGELRAEERREQQVGVRDVRDALVARAVERGRRHDQNRAVQEEREHQRDGRID